jgi:outer membrane protein TolC
VIAEQDFSGSIAQADAARAQRLPRISLSGNIARQQILTGDERISGSVFSVGRCKSVCRSSMAANAMRK